jgi:hypothetical protein
VAKPFILVYGKTGVGKTTWWMEMAAHLHKTTGKKTRLYVGDNLATVEDQGLIEDGIVEAFPFMNRRFPLTVTKRIGEGFWPKNLATPATDASDLVPFAQSGADNVGLIVFEGVSFVADYIMGAQEGGLAARAAKGEDLGPAAAVRIVEGTESFGSNGMAHYMLVQSRIKEILRTSKDLAQTHDRIVLWTAHERAAEDRDDGNEKIIGPEAGGKALTAKLGASFDYVVHLTTATKKVKGTDPVTGKAVEQLVLERRAYNRDHADPDGTVFVKYLANVRCPLVGGKNPMPEFITPPSPLKMFAILTEAKAALRKQRETALTDADKAVAL